MRKWCFKFDAVYDVGDLKYEAAGTGVRPNDTYPLKEGQVGRLRNGLYALIDGLIKPIIPSKELKERLKEKHMIITAQRTVDGVVYPVQIDEFADTKGASKAVFDLCFDRKLYVPKTIVVDEMQAQVLTRNIQFEITIDGQALKSQKFDEIRRFIKGFVPGKKRAAPKNAPSDAIDAIPAKYKTSPEEEKQYCREQRGDGSAETAFEKHCAKIDEMRSQPQPV
jgi:hypothetical protein